MNNLNDDVINSYEIKSNALEMNYPNINNLLEFDGDLINHNNIDTSKNQIESNNLYSFSNNYINNCKYASNFHIKELSESDKLLLDKYNNYYIDNNLNSYSDIDEKNNLGNNLLNNYNDYNKNELSNKHYNCENKNYLLNEHSIIPDNHHDVMNYLTYNDQYKTINLGLNEEMSNINE